VAVNEVLVPTERTYTLFGAEPVDPSALYRHPWMFFSNMAEVPLGVARSAISHTTGVVAAKVPLGSFAPASEDPLVAEAVARATALYRSSRAYYHDSLGRLWNHLLSGSVPREAWVDVRLATTNAFHSCLQAVQLCFEATGTSALPAAGPLSRYLRDATTMTSHFIAQRKSYLGAGRHLLGLDPGARVSEECQRRASVPTLDSDQRRGGIMTEHAARRILSGKTEFYLSRVISLGLGRPKLFPNCRSHWN
jgi:hypothetical protein